MDQLAEHRKARDEDFDELMSACNAAKDAARNGKSIATENKETSEPVAEADLSKLRIEDDPSPAPAQRVQFASPPATSRPLDNLDSSDHPQTVTEKDDNGFVYYKCRFCGLTYNYMNTLRAHERIHDVSQPYVCGKCGESFEFACQLEYHTSQHGDVKGYKCECGRTFFSYTEMLYHKHTDEIQADKEKVYGAPLLVTPSTSNQPNVHDLPIPEFAEKGFEPKHPMKVYNDVRTKPYICEYCSKSYADSRGLAYHMYSHRGEKQFNPRSSRYLMGRQGIGFTDRSSYDLLQRTSSYSSYPSALY